MVDEEAMTAFVEQMGLMWERYGANRTQGRVLGYLMVCDPPEQTAADLMDALQVSQGSVSTATRGLEPTGLIERVTKPGDRRSWYLMPPDAWRNYPRFAQRQYGVMREMAEEALAALVDEPETRKARAEGLRATVSWWKKRNDELLEEWEKER